MNNKLALLFMVFILICLSCVTKLPLVMEENLNMPLITISPADPVDIIDIEGMRIQIDYKWNYSRKAFEERQNAAEGIKYTLTYGKFCGGMHDFAWPLVYDNLSDSGYFTFLVENKCGSPPNEGTAYGNGRLMYGISCKYIDKEGKKHSGAVSNYLEIPVIFVK